MQTEQMDVVIDELKQNQHFRRAQDPAAAHSTLESASPLRAAPESQVSPPKDPLGDGRVQIVPSSGEEDLENTAQAQGMGQSLPEAKPVATIDPGTEAVREVPKEEAVSGEGKEARQEAGKTLDRAQAEQRQRLSVQLPEETANTPDGSAGERAQPASQASELPISPIKPLQKSEEQVLHQV